MQSQGIISPSLKIKMSPGTKSIFLILVYPEVFLSFKNFLLTLNSIIPSKEKSLLNFLLNLIYLNITFKNNTKTGNNKRRLPK